jgi:serine/threonine-protein kinase HipA
MSRVLDVYLHGARIGTLTQQEGGLSFSYAADAKTAVSLSLPTQAEPHTGRAVKAFFSGLLPDDIIRHRLGRVII